MPVSSYAQIDPQTLPDPVDGQSGADFNYSDVSGDGVVDQLDIDNFTQTHTILEYNSFSIGQNGVVNFYNGTDGVTLNRVNGGEASQIFGTLWAQGQIFLINSHGVLFAPGSHVNVGGMLASTLDIADADFLAGNLYFTAGEGAAAVINQGAINMNGPGGFAVLLGSRVENSGSIYAYAGKVALAAGDAIQVDLDSEGLVSIAVPTSANVGDAAAAVLNSGTITASGGTIVLNAEIADELFDAAVNSSNTIQAQQIYIDAENGDIVLSGSILAQGPAGLNNPIVDVDTDESIILNGVTMMAESYGSGPATVSLNAGEDIDMDNGLYNYIGAGSSSYGSPLVSLLAEGNISMYNSDIFVSGDQGSVAQISIQAGDTISMSGVELLSRVENTFGGDNVGEAHVDVEADGDVSIYYSSIMAEVVNGEEEYTAEGEGYSTTSVISDPIAEININSDGGNILLDNGFVNN